LKRYDLDPDGKRLPVRFDTTTNGEYAPLPLTPGQQLANRLSHETVSENAARLGMGRRAFLTSTMGAAAVLGACNRTNANAGGRYSLAADAALDSDAAAATLSGDEFIFDVQLHCADPKAAWTQVAAGGQWRAVLGQAFPQAVKCKTGEYDCYSAESLVKESSWRCTAPKAGGPVRAGG